MFVQLFIHGIANGQAGVVVGEQTSERTVGGRRGNEKEKKRKNKEQDPKFSDVVESFVVTSSKG